jgi:hypothetical protein
MRDDTCRSYLDENKAAILALAARLNAGSGDGGCSSRKAKFVEDTIGWLELGQRKGFSQGGFVFGKDCARIMLAEHAAAQSEGGMSDAE